MIIGEIIRIIRIGLNGYYGFITLNRLIRNRRKYTIDTNIWRTQKQRNQWKFRINRIIKFDYKSNKRYYEWKQMLNLANLDRFWYW